MNNLNDLENFQKTLETIDLKGLLAIQLLVSQQALRLQLKKENDHKGSKKVKNSLILPNHYTPEASTSQDGRV